MPAFAQDAIRARKPQTKTSSELHAFFDAEWERSLRESPETASQHGDPRYNDRWTDLSLPAIAAREAADRPALAKLKAIDRAQLSAEDQLSYDVFLWQIEKAVERQKFKEYQRAVSQRGGIQNAEELTEVLPFATTKDYRDWLARMRGITSRSTTPHAVAKAWPQANCHKWMQRIRRAMRELVDDPAKSPFYRPFAKFNDGVPESERAALQSEARKAIADDIVPAYRKFAAFFDGEYLPKTRESIAAADLPDGKAYYDFTARYFTTTDLSAEEIHAIA